MSWKQFGGTDNISKHILTQSNNSGKSIFEIEQNILQIGNTRLGENQQNGIWFKGLGHSTLSLSDFSGRIASTAIEERYYNKYTGDSELFLFKAKNINPNIINPYTDTSFNPNLERGDRIRMLAPTIAFDTYNSSIDYDSLDTTNENYKNENTRVIINENGFVGINTIHPGQFLDIHGKINLQSSTNKINMYISNNSNPDPSNVGINNIGIGAYVFSNQNFNSSHNIALGHSSLKNITSGYSNISIGNSSLIKTTTGKNNIAMGNSTLANITNGDYNLAIGNDTLKTINSGSNNIAIGTSSNSISSSSNDNISIGHLSAQNIIGYTNNLIGTNSGINLIGNYNSGFGHYSFSNSKGDYNVALGYQCLKNSSLILSNATYNKNVFVGSYDNGGQILLGDSNTGIGYNTQLSSSGNSNVSVGSKSLTSNSGSRNTSIGAQSNINNSGSDNVSIGINSLTHNNSTNLGSLNTCIGSYTGTILSGDANTTIGCYSDIKPGCNKSTSIGCYARADISNAFILGDPSDNYIKYGMGTSKPEFTMDIRNTLRDVDIHLKCGPTNHSGLLFTRYSDDNSSIGDVASTFFMQYNSIYDTNFVTNFVNTLDISPNFEEKTYLGFTKDNKYIPVVTYSNLGRIGFLNTTPEYSFDVSCESRFKSSVKFDDMLFAGDANTNSSFYDQTGVTKFYFKDKTLFVDGFDVNGAVNFTSTSDVTFNKKPSLTKGAILYGAANYSLDLYHEDGGFRGKTDARIDGHLLIGKSLSENQRIYNLDVAGDVRFDASANLNYIDVSGTANFNHNVNINSGICSFHNTCQFDIYNKTCSFLQGSNLNIAGEFVVDKFSAPFVKSSRFTSTNDHSFNNIFNIYDNPIDNSGILDSSGFFGFSFGDVNNNYDQLVQIRSKDIGSNTANNLDRFYDGKSKNQLLFSSENNTNNSQLLLGSFCDNVDAKNKSFIMATDSLYIGKSNPNDLNIYDSSANIIIDTSGVVKITGNNLVNSNSVVFDVSGNSKMNNLHCLQNISGGSITVTGDISCGNFIYAKKLIVDDITNLQNIGFSTDLNINDISAVTMKVHDKFDISNLLSIEVSSNSITFNDANIDISSTSPSFHFNVYRPMTIVDSALNISGGSINIDNGNMNISGSIIADNFEINANLTAIYASIDDIDVSSIDITTATIINSDINKLDASNIFIKNSGVFDASAGICRFGNSNLYGTLDVSGTIKSNIADISTCNINIVNSTNIVATHTSIDDVSINNTLDVVGNVNCDTLNGKGIIPIGGIILYNGYTSDIPNNWRICDGSGGFTPDLSPQSIFETSSNIIYYVRENNNNDIEPYYIFSDTSGGTVLNSASNPLTLITGNNYTFIASNILGTYNTNNTNNYTNGFNVGNAYKSNNVNINVNSNGSGIETGASGVGDYRALNLPTEYLSFTIPRLFTSVFKYFNSDGDNSRIVSFAITDNYSIVYIKRIS
jgi:hypothetical protein